MISEQLARRFKLGLGDRIALPASAGDWPLEVAGIYADYGNPKGQVARQYRRAGCSVFRRFRKHDWGCGSPRPRYPRSSRPSKINSASTAATLSDQATLKAESTRIFNRTFAVTAALNTFTLGVAGVALLTSLLTLSNSRLPQLAPLWAIGITRRRLAAIELLKTMSVALITALLALPLGLLGGMVPDRGGECESLWLAAAVSDISAAVARTAGRRHAGGFSRSAASRSEAGAHAARQTRQDFRR